MSIGKITKGNNSAKNAGGATVVNLCTSSVMLYISTKFCEIISSGIKSYRVDTISILKITRGNNSAKNVGGVTVVNLCTSSGHALFVMLVISNKFCDIISIGIKVIERTRFLY